MAQIAGPIGLKYGREPVAFILAFVSANRAAVIAIINRASQRENLTVWKAEGHSEVMTASNDDSNATLAKKFALWAVKSPEALRDEHRRRSFNLPVGLDGTSSGTVPQNSNDQAIAAGINAAATVAQAALGALLNMGSGDPGAGNKPPETVKSGGGDYTVLIVAALAVGFLLLRR